MSIKVVESLPDLLPGMLPRLWAFSLRLCKDRHDAEDLLHRACVRGLERMHQLQPGTAPLSWMFSILYTTWINELKARKLRSHAIIDWKEHDLEPSNAYLRSPEGALHFHQVIAAIEELPEIQRTAILLVIIEGLSYAEAATVLDVPIGTVMSRLSRARRSIGSRFVYGTRPDVSPAQRILSQ